MPKGTLRLALTPAVQSTLPVAIENAESDCGLEPVPGPTARISGSPSPSKSAYWTARAWREAQVDRAGLGPAGRRVQAPPGLAVEDPHGRRLPARHERSRPVPLDRERRECGVDRVAPEPSSRPARDGQDDPPQEVLMFGSRPVGRSRGSPRGLGGKLLEGDRGDEVGDPVAVDVRDRGLADDPSRSGWPDGSVRASPDLRDRRPPGPSSSARRSRAPTRPCPRRPGMRSPPTPTRRGRAVPSPLRSGAGLDEPGQSRSGARTRAARDDSARGGLPGSGGFRASQTTLPVAPSRRTQLRVRPLDEVGLPGVSSTATVPGAKAIGVLPGRFPAPQGGAGSSPSSRPSSRERAWTIVSPRLTAKR